MGQMTIVEGFDEHRVSRTEVKGYVQKYWLVVLVVFLFGTVATWASFPIFFTDMYESNTTLLVKIGRETSETPGTVQRGQVMTQSVQVTDTNSEVQMLSSRALVEQVVDKLGPDAFKSVLLPPEHWYGYPKYAAKKTARAVKSVYTEFLIAVNLKKRLSPREDAIVRVAGGVKVEPIKDSDTLVLKVSTPSPKLSVEVSNALLDAYLQARTMARRMPAGSDFFRNQVEEAKQRLAQVQKDREKVRERWGLTSAAEQRTQYLNQLAGIESEIVRNDAEIAKLKEQRQLMVERTGALPDLVRKEQVDASNPSIQSIKDRVTALQLERAKTASRYQPDSEIMRKIDAEIAEVQSALQKEPTTILNTVTDEANPSKREFRISTEQQAIQIAGLETRNKFLQGPRAELMARLNQLNLGADALDVTDREYKSAEDDYLVYAKRLEESRMSEQLDAQRVANVAVVAPPETPIEPVYPRKLFIMGIAMAVSLLVGIAFAALLETTEDRISDERTLSAVDGATFLGVMKIGKVG